MSGRTWALLNRRPGSDQVEACWLLVTDVPSSVRKAEVLERLAAWRYSSRYAPALGDRVSVRLSTGNRPADATGKRPDVVTWGELAPASRRLTLEVSDATHAALVELARRKGVSLAAWCVYALEIAAGGGGGPLGRGR